MKRNLVIAYFVVLHIALAFVLVKSDFLDRVQGALGLTQPGWRHVELAQHLLQERMDPSVPAGAAVFLGDSITHGLATPAVAPNSVNFGIGQQTAGQLAASIDGYGSLRRASRVYLSVGTNDISAGKAGTLEGSFQIILAAIPSEIPLSWSAVMPRAGLTKDIRAANALITRMCAARSKCTFVDTYSAMSDAAGAPLSGIYFDGIHPNAKGYGIWINALRERKL